MLPTPRTEFGAIRSFCACKVCIENCRHMPGYLIPADLTRMLPAGADPLVWAETQLLASPGALVLKNGVPLRIPTLVPAVKADGSCIHLEGKRCTIHQIAPFGCAFFSCSTDKYSGDLLSGEGLKAIMRDREEHGLYARIWEHLNAKGLRQQKAEQLRSRMRK